MGRMHLRGQGTGTLVAAAALAAVIGLATPAAAVDSSTTVQASPSTTTVGNPATLTATVACAEDPSGGLGVTFWDGPDVLDTIAVNSSGQATYTATFNVTGTHTITAAYNGNTGCDASSNTTTVTVTQTPAPPTPGPCLLLCGGPGLFNFSTGNIHNEVNIDSHNGRPRDDVRPPHWSNYGRAVTRTVTPTV
ncbi:Ig-like domain-containing protein [Streptomyces sp. SR27]|uniref:Ig-like domain-containing protein n=1 Tax=Streptomyces sp. SR27 TaxID=3076630 RepID=UPI00295B103B|nr:Ig-like domain-containing protein [Streptomyces sp. SR27]MDV9187443.1 Ig-like domain-containing protein [Streptomyces sp. SR27]